MGQLNVKSFDMAFTMQGGVDGRKDTKDVSDDFKKLLKDNPKSESKAEAKTEQKTTAKPDDAKTSEDSKTDEMISEVQMGQLLMGMQTIKEQPEELADGEMMNLETGVSEVVSEGNPLTQEETAVFQPTEGQEETDAEAMPTAEKAPEVPRTAGLEAEKSVHGEVELKVSEETEKLPQDTGTVLKKQPKAEEDRELPPENPLPQTSMPNVRNTSFSQETHQVHTQRMYVSQPEEIPQKLPQELLTQISHGAREFEIQIAPEHLGKIAIKVVYQQEQTVISIACSEKTTLELMGHHAREIGSIMERNLGTETNVYVEEKPQDYLNQRNNENDNSGREAEQERQKEENRKNQTNDSGQFLQKLRLGLVE